MVAQPLLHTPDTRTRRTPNKQNALYPNNFRAIVKDMGYTMREISQETNIPYYWAAGKAPIPRYAREKLTSLFSCSVENLAPKYYEMLLRQAIQAPALVEMLTTLIEHPDVQRGLLMAQEYFLDEYEPAPLTQEEMLNEVETSLSRRAWERGKAIERVLGGKPSSYLCNLGCVLGMIGRGLIYARSSEI